MQWNRNGARVIILGDREVAGFEAKSTVVRLQVHGNVVQIHSDAARTQRLENRLVVRGIVEANYVEMPG